MKKTITTILMFAVGTVIGYAQTNVISQNAVGYVKRDLVNGDFYLLRYDFLDIDGNATGVSDIIGDQLPTNSQVLVWNGNGFDFEEYQEGKKLAAGTFSWVPDTSVILPGMAFFVQVPTTTDPGPHTLFMTGEVPGENNNSETTTVGVAASGAFSALGYPYPAAVEWTNTSLATVDVTTNDQLLTYNNGYSFIEYQEGKKLAAGTFAWTANPTLQPGDGFFYQRNSAIANSWTEVKPYAWP